ncbi:MAG: hypothetical protein GY874_15795 [Desulfobacteraceae bacterium]|nr:hypothetical protein [Desulfobacteraceae bacterium]
MMPTNCRKARLLLKQGKAVIVGHSPFTIRLKYPTGQTKQELILGIDAGYSNIDYSIWSDGYFCCSTGKASIDTVGKYIESQVIIAQRRFIPKAKDLGVFSPHHFIKGKKNEENISTEQN